MTNDETSKETPNGTEEGNEGRLRRPGSTGRRGSTSALVAIPAAGLLGAGVALASGAVPWSYGGKTGPKAWGRLSEAYRLCERGSDQSPIDLRDAAPGEGDKLRFEYFPSPLRLTHNGHTLQMDVEKGSSLQNGRGRFELKQFHFHTPSEHTRAGKRFPLEIHLVHADAHGALAVVGVLVDIGKRHAALDTLFANMPAQTGTRAVEGLLLNANALLPRTGGYDSYPGSLTTPPCTEGVSWHVLKTPLEISKPQLDAFRKVFKMNARPVQPLRDRVLREM